MIPPPRRLCRLLIRALRQSLWRQHHNSRLGRPPSCLLPPPHPAAVLYWHNPRPSYSAPECTNHVAESAEHPYPMTEIFHHPIENDGGQRVPLMIYGKNKKAQERIAYRSNNPTEWSHLWEMRKPQKQQKRRLLTVMTLQQVHCPWRGKNLP